MGRRQCDVLLVGGGSGGHLTPLKAVAKALQEDQPDMSIGHVGQKGDPLNSILDDCNAIKQRFTIRAGKFRRYHGESLLQRLLDVKTWVFNIRDLFYFLIGLVQSLVLLRRVRPSVVFSKGGYVAAPLCLAAGWMKIPYLTHDSDAMVSLAHRIVAKRAKLHLTALAPELYQQYARDKTVQVGVPISNAFVPVTPASRKRARQYLGIAETAKLIFVIGGGLGAQVVNDAVIHCAKELLADENVVIAHVTGKKTYDDNTARYQAALSPEEMQRFQMLSFTDKVLEYGMAADVVITRAGATNMAEFCALGKACIIVPNPLLTGGHQLKNARAYESAQAAIVLEEDTLAATIVPAVQNILADASYKQQLEQRIQQFYIPHAATTIATYIQKSAQSNHEAAA